MLAPSTLDVATIDTVPEIDAPLAAPAQPASRPDVQPRWNLATRIAFRLCFLYFSLYVVSTQMLGGLLPFGWVHNLEGTALMQRVVTWTGTHVFHVGYAYSFQTTGSGDKTVDYLEVFCLLTVAVAATTAR
jgi:hypothetical protein